MSRVNFLYHSYGRIHPGRGRKPVLRQVVINSTCVLEENVNQLHLRLANLLEQIGRVVRSLVQCASLCRKVVAELYVKLCMSTWLMHP